MIARNRFSSLTYAAVFVIFCAFLASPCFAQSGLEGRITVAIGALSRVVNVLIAGFIVWSGFLIAKGDGSGFRKLGYGVIGLIVVNSAYLILNYFR